jgi:hypothetical protein
MKIQLAAAFATAVLASGAYAADPIGVVSTPGISFGEYTGTTPVGEGKVDINELFFIDEQTGPLGKSWYIFFDPKGLKTVDATITFDGAITGAPGITYGTSKYIGPEARTDWFAYIPGSNQMTIHFEALDPGDDIRVFTSPVPEPATYAMMALGLVGFGALKLRQRRQS